LNIAIAPTTSATKIAATKTSGKIPFRLNKFDKGKAVVVKQCVALLEEQ
jgi:hypothetical protein